jgi:hypothetical protein
MKQRFLISILLLCALGFSAFAGEHPNVVFIVCDDLNDYVTGFDRHPQSMTPNMAKLAATVVVSMRMWQNRIQEDLAGLTVIPRGFGGSHFSDLIYYAERIIFPYKPRAILIYEGDAD